ncbi:hypothetical protein ACH5RR_015196 [Cinchona calisaya]|uniref:F-box domain-containing protein n=1 Tax=Cinchona calisaya TaxID=153742 RepID=A0ABD2ZW04_9GENT
MEDLGVKNQEVGTVAEKQMKKAEDPFQRLPDDVIIFHIFDKILDAKSLCRCSCVSKRFSFLVFQSHHVSLKIPIKILHQEPNPALPRARSALQSVHSFTIHMGHFPALIRHILLRPPRLIGVDIDISFLSNLTTQFLTKFTSTKSLFLEFDYSGLMTTSNEPLVKWKFDSKSARYILLISPRNLDCHNIIDVADLVLIKIHLDCNLFLAYNTFHLMEMLFSWLPESLNHLVITDTKNRGELNLGGSDLVAIRDRHANSSSQGRIRFIDDPLREMPLPNGGGIKFDHIFLANEWNADEDCLRIRKAFEGRDDDLIEPVVNMVREIRLRGGF